MQIGPAGQRDSGYYVRIQKDGKWDSYDIYELTPEELANFFETKDKPQLIHWLLSIIDNAKKGKI